jgi:DNA-binding NarL/FixJ family response regulator
MCVRCRLADTPVMTNLADAPAPLRILVVDPDDRIRETLAALLCIDGQCAVVGSAGTADAAVALAASFRPDVVVLDPRIPAMDGGRAIIICLREAAPGVRILVLNWSTASDGGDPAAAADAYIKKTFRPHELIDAVVAAARTSVT